MTYEYQDWYQRLAPKERQKMSCPVCKALLGYRDKNQPFMEHCEECKATFTWKCDDSIPIAHLDCAKKSKRCTCGRCG